jgi:NAD(P)-dependent dehydrogenase (short-subunit alcohol dehydrogenase family)
MLKGKVALITGGGSGIGRAIAVEYARHGANVVVAGRRAEPGEESVEIIERAGGTARFVAADVTDEPDVRRMVETCLAEFGRLDVAVNNAGGEFRAGPLVRQDTESWRRTLDNNATSVFLCLRHEIEAMLAAGAGTIVNIASTLGIRAMPGVAAYVAAKHAVVGLTRAAAVEYAAQGIRVNAIAAGSVDTPMFRRGPGGNVRAKAYMVGKHPMGRIGTPEEIAATAAFLASDAAGFMTGAVLTADGGWTAQ